MKNETTRAILRIHAVQHQGVDVDVEVEGGPETLDDRYGPATPIPDVLLRTSPAAQAAEHRAHEDADHRPTQPVIPREQVAHPVRQRQHPLAHGNFGKHVVYEVGRPFGHSAPAATGTHGPASARLIRRLAWERSIEIFTARNGESAGGAVASEEPIEPYVLQ